MGIVILLVLLILVVAFGPIILGFFALMTAVFGSVAAAALICFVVAVGFVYLLGCAYWVIWWCCDPKAANAALRRAEADQRR